MEEPRLDHELKRLYERLPFLWKDYDFHVKYFTRDYGMYYKGFIIGLENNVCKLIFEKETGSPFEPIIDHIGTRFASFTGSNYSYFAADDWYPIRGLIQWLTGIQYEVYRDVDKDLEHFSQYLKLHMDKLLDLFKDPAEFDRKLEHLRNVNKGRQITVEKLKEERTRLQTLGQDSSLEAAIASLRGGKNE